jgi:hypothetical protein
MSRKEARAIHAFLQDLERTTGRVRPTSIVDAARSPRSLLHRYFEWDDDVAAERYRLKQAQSLVQAVVLVVEYEGRQIETRAWSSIRVKTPEWTGRVYMETSKAMDVPDLRAQLLGAALRDMKIFRARYAALREVADVLAAMDGVTKRIT